MTYNSSAIISYQDAIAHMEVHVLMVLAGLELGYGYRKWAIMEQTGIPMDILTVILKRLKYAGKIELIMIFDESTGHPDGSGYCLTAKKK